MYGIDEDEIAIVFTPEIVERMYHRICWVLNEGILAGFSVFDQMKEFKARESLLQKARWKERGIITVSSIANCLISAKSFSRGKS